MTKKLSAAVIAILLALPLITTADSPMHFFKSLGKTLTPAMSANAQKIAQHRQIAAGEMFTLALPVNTSTGYTWILRTLPADISLVSTGMQPSAHCKAEMTGCASEQTFTFRAEQLGQGTIELLYMRPWEKTANSVWLEEVDIEAPSA